MSVTFDVSSVIMEVVFPKETRSMKYELGRRIAGARRKHGMTQDELMPMRKGLELSIGKNIPGFCHTMDRFLEGAGQ